ncbi:MAG: thiamine pyrophosphate-binding protein [Nitrospinota bacterium]|nr:thiamine pyrophosphate-binding protein [Nitrospinota bacterium]
MGRDSQQVHTGQIVVDALVRENVEKMFCVPGSHVLQFYDGLRDAPSINLITCKMEPNVSLMADAYGRLTGKPGVCLLTAGPGVANSVAGLAQAYGAASPVVHLTGGIPLKATREAFHGVDNPAFTQEMCRNVTKWSARIERIEDIPATMAKAFRICQSGRPGPVHVEFPRLSDYEPYILQADPVSLPAYQSEGVEVIEPSGEDIEQIALRLLSAKAPVICAGKGVMRKRGMKELLEIAEILSAPVVYPQDSMGIIPDDHPLAAGHFIATRSDPRFDYVMGGADLLLSVGVRASTAETVFLNERAPGESILVGFDDAEDENYSRKDEIVADPKLFLAALLERLKGESRPGGEEVKREIARIRAEFRESVRTFIDGDRDDVPVHPGFIVETIAKTIAPDAVVVSDVGNCQMWGRYYLPLTNPESFLQSGVWNAMSYCLPTAIVAKLENPGRQVVGISGDGAFLMTIGDFVTACEYGANAVFVVFNDGAFSQMVGQQERLYGEAYGCEFKSPDFAEIAGACGGLGIRVEEPGQLAPALKRALAAGVPAIIDVATTYRPTPPY